MCHALGILDEALVMAILTPLFMDATAALSLAWAALWRWFLAFGPGNAGRKPVPSQRCS